MAFLRPDGHGLASSHDPPLVNPLARYLKVAPRVPVADLGRAVAFYNEVLKFKVGLLWPDEAPTFAILEHDGVCIQFQVADEFRAEAAQRVNLCFDVDDVRALHATLQGKVIVEWGPEVYWYGRREFAIRDRSGYLLIFSEETADPPTCHEEA
jgi:catechol 2,3-dioxygenase-like lactoylglutathione lyase family enzyme